MLIYVFPLFIVISFYIGFVIGRGRIKKALKLAKNYRKVLDEMLDEMVSYRDAIDQYEELRDVVEIKKRSE